MSGLVAFMNSAVGRILRIVIGLVLIYIGLFGSLQGSIGGYILAIIGLVPVFLGATGRCLLQSVAGK